MGLLYSAAVAWSNLYNKKYDMLLGRKGKWSSSFSLDFCPEDFPHLAGMQYANDVDFGINKAEVRSGKLIEKILNREINDELIEKSVNWERKIRGRLEGLIALEETLDSDFLICKYDQHKVPHGSLIEAKYVIKNLSSGITFFVFVDDSETRWFCRSVFQMNIADYTINQTHVTVLKKMKWHNNKVVIDYINPNYKPVEE